MVILHGITPQELQSRPGMPVFIKKRNLIDLNDIGTYLKELRSRVEKA